MNINELNIWDQYICAAISSLEGSAEHDHSSIMPHDERGLMFWYSPEVLAARAGKIADAMIREREKRLKG